MRGVGKGARIRYAAAMNLHGDSVPAGQGPVHEVARPDFGVTGIHEWHRGQNCPPPHLTPSLLACTTRKRMRHPWWRRAVGGRENGCPQVEMCTGRENQTKHQHKAKTGPVPGAPRLSFVSGFPFSRAPPHGVLTGSQRSAGEITIADATTAHGAPGVTMFKGNSVDSRK